MLCVEEERSVKGVCVACRRAMMGTMSEQGKVVHGQTSQLPPLHTAAVRNANISTRSLVSVLVRESYRARKRMYRPAYVSGGSSSSMYAAK
jgi:hypothetical protein